MQDESQVKSSRRLWRADSQFCLLAEHFIRRMTTIEIADGTDPEFGAVGTLALVAVPGAFYSFVLLDKYSTLLRVMRGGPMSMDVYTASAPDKYLLLACSMALTALLVALLWDRILPGQADHSVLASMPIRTRTIFLANLGAIAFVAALFIADLNAVSSILFPLVVLSDVPASFLDHVRFISVHACCVFVASGFAFLLCLSILAIMMALLPASLFRRVSALVRFAIVLSSCGLMWTAFYAPREFLQSRWVPGTWYTALYQVLQNRGTPALKQLAFTGVAALFLAFFIALLGVTFSYRRHFMRIAESSTPAGTDRIDVLVPVRIVLNGTLLRAGFDRAMYWLGLRLLLRSEPHMIRFGVFGALGFVTFAGQILTGASAIVASFPLVFLVVTGFRTTLKIPAGIRALPSFQTCAVWTDARPVLRKLLGTVLLVVLTPLSLEMAMTASPLTAVLHVVILGSAASIAFDCMLFRYVGIPFVSPSSSFQNGSVMVVTLYFLGFLAFTTAGPSVERMLLSHPLASTIAPITALLVSFFTRSVDEEDRQPDDGRVVQTLSIQG
jgi:hypothetical protein